MKILILLIIGIIFLSSCSLWEKSDTPILKDFSTVVTLSWENLTNTNSRELSEGESLNSKSLPSWFLQWGEKWKNYIVRRNHNEEGYDTIITYAVTNDNKEIPLDESCNLWDDIRMCISSIYETGSVLIYWFWNYYYVLDIKKWTIIWNVTNNDINGNIKSMLTPDYKYFYWCTPFWIDEGHVDIINIETWKKEYEYKYENGPIESCEFNIIEWDYVLHFTTRDYEDEIIKKFSYFFKSKKIVEKNSIDLNSWNETTK